MSAEDKALRKAKQRNKWMGIVAGGLLGGTIGYLSMSIFLNFGVDNQSFPWYYKLLIIPLVIAAFWLAILAHELGHVVAGLSQKLVFRLLCVGPLTLEKEGGKMVWKWNRNLNSYGGLALCLPEDQKALVKRYMIFIAGGPAASVLWGLLLLLLLLLTDFDRAQLQPYLLHSFLLLSCVISFALGVLASLPMHTEGFTSDGGKLLNLLKGGLSAIIETTLISYIAAGTAGMRPSLQDPQPLHEAIDLPQTSHNKVYFHSMLYGHYLDVGDLEKAALHLKAYVAGDAEVPQAMRAFLYLEQAWFEARFHKNAPEAKAWFAKEKIEPIVPKALVLRAEAAIAYAEAKYTLAIEQAQKAIDELPKQMDKGGAIAEKDWLEELIGICEAQVVTDRSMNLNQNTASAVEEY